MHKRLRLEQPVLRGDLLQTVCQYLSPLDVIRCTTVCKTWHREVRTTDAIRSLEYWRPYTALRSREATLPNFFTTFQKDLRPSMRHILLGWLNEVYEELDFLQHKRTVRHRAAAIVDHVLAVRQITRANVQKLGCIAIRVACKLEEREFPSAMHMFSLCAEIYRVTEFPEFEIEALNALNWSIAFPITPQFLDMFLEDQMPEEEIRTLCDYLAELAMFQTRMITVSPSLRAAAIAILGFAAFGKSFHSVLVHCGHPWQNVFDTVVTLYTAWESGEVLDPHLKERYVLVASLSPPRLDPILDVIRPNRQS